MYCHPYSMNAPVMVELEGETDPLKIAMKELKLVTATVYTYVTVLCIRVFILIIIDVVASSTVCI